MPEPKGNLVTPIGIDAAGNLYALLVDASGHLQIDTVSSGLPAGAATAALQLPDNHNVVVTALPGVGVRPGQIQEAHYNGVPGDVAWHTLTTIATCAQLSSLDLVSDHAQTRIRLTGAAQLYLGSDATTPQITAAITIGPLQNSGGESSLFKIGIHDAVNDYYSLFLKRDLLTATSLVIEYRAGLNTADVGISVTWVELT